MEQAGVEPSAVFRNEAAHVGVIDGHVEAEGFAAHPAQEFLERHRVLAVILTESQGPVVGDRDDGAAR